MLPVSLVCYGTLCPSVIDSYSYQWQQCILGQSAHFLPMIGTVHSIGLFCITLNFPE